MTTRVGLPFCGLPRGNPAQSDSRLRPVAALRQPAALRLATGPASGLALSDSGGARLLWLLALPRGTPAGHTHFLLLSADQARRRMIVRQTFGKRVETSHNNSSTRASCC